MNSEALLVASKESVLEANAEKTKYLFMSRDQNTGQNIEIKIGNKIDFLKVGNLSCVWEQT
jgi:hypothetical protein